MSDDHGVPDQLSAPTFTPSVVDVSDGPAEVRVEVPLRDDGGPGPARGIRHAGLAYWSPSWTHGSRVFRVGGSIPLAPTGTGDTWAGTITVPRFAPSGDYEVAAVDLTDGVNSTRQLEEPPDPALTGASFTVVSEHDDLVPEATTLVISKERVDTRRRARWVRFTVQARDETSGVRSVRLHLGGDRRHWSVDLSHVDGDTWSGRLRVPTWVGDGIWRVGSVMVHDRVGAFRLYQGTSLSALGRTTFAVVSRRDGGEPSVEWIRSRRDAIDVRTEPRRVRFTARIRDAASGVGASGLVVATREGMTVPMRLVKGTRRDGVWRATVRFSDCEPYPGRPHVRVDTRDRAGNRLESRAVRPLRIRAGDHTPPVVSRATPDGTAWVPADGPLPFRFNEAVSGVDAGSVLVQERVEGGLTEPVPGTWACRRRDGDFTSCVSGRVRFASWTPTEPLDPDSRYRVMFNPEHDLGIRDRSGNAFRREEHGILTLP